MTDQNEPKTTGNDALSGVDPGGARPTRPGNPDKSGPADPQRAHDEQHVTSGDRNDATHLNEVDSMSRRHD